MSTTRVRTSISRVDRLARECGVTLQEDGKRRRFRVGESELVVKEKGAGVFEVESYLGGNLEAYRTVTEGQLRRYLMRAS